MTRQFHLGLKAAYVLAISGALAFGSKELVATPTAKAALTCDQVACDGSCSEAGYDYGMCRSWGCQCYIRMCGNVQC